MSETTRTGTAPSRSLATEEPAGAVKVLPARHPWRWVATAVVAVVAAMAVNALVTNPAWEWPTVGEFLFSATILESMWLTVKLTIVGTAIGLVLGTVLALMRMSKNPLLQGVSFAYISVFRSVPLILQLLFWFNLAILYKNIGFGVPFGPQFWTFSTQNLIAPLTAAFLGLGLHQAAYFAEIVRSGFLAIDPGQREAAAALGIPQFRQFWRIQLPQALRIIVPTTGNEIIGLLKGTSVVYIMALPELFYQVQVVYNRTGRVIPLLLVAAIWYFVLTTVLSIAQWFVERYYGRGSDRNQTELPLLKLVRTVRAARTRRPGVSR
ncbi:amino acid ABC transporter permease [Kineococcus rhizosphaerae]|uniref:Amino acid ABC transporter membrane protein (PAAT family) n=1 Tax=Kineococcus rhizosphaerae TaxID=559628 RepID=A0A2T0QY04_9ACTN|nr:amino acid ABC transporter permease [Kineococcus rhizosphaerae]PRY11054.1 amino acid ABC transporter membrane protein (PAAT family) [Kineococcus rhizosphaerae]